MNAKVVAILATVAMSLALATSAVAHRSPHCFLSVAQARNVVASYEANEIAHRYTLSYMFDGHQRRGPRKVVVWVVEHINDPDMGLGDWRHPLHVTLYGGKARVALEGYRSKPFAVPVHCG
jgi:hypothetical protein